MIELQTYRDGVNDVLLSAIAMVEQLRALEPFWDVLSEEQQTAILLGLDRLERIHANLHMGIQGAGTGAEASMNAAANVLRRI